MLCKIIIMRVLLLLDEKSKIVLFPLHKSLSPSKPMTPHLSLIHTLPVLFLSLSLMTPLAGTSAGLGYRSLIYANRARTQKLFYFNFCSSSVFFLVRESWNLVMGHSKMDKLI